jgi:antirestriction protein ArdC
MSASEAVSFDRRGKVNPPMLEEIAKDKGCGCVPYQDWFTFKRWEAQGFHVRKGEHGTKIFMQRENIDPETQAVTSVSRFKTYVFCRCQVEINEDPS